jgi:alpha-methylacyl-CoA racemase
VTPSRHDGVFSGRFPYYRTYDTLDGRRVTLACTEPALWERFCATIVRHDLLDAGPRPGDLVSPPSETQLRAGEALEQVFRTATSDDWFKLLAPRGAGIGKVYELADLIHDPHMTARGSIVERTGQGGQKYLQVAPPIRMSDSEMRVAGRAPALGEHTTTVLEAAGLSAHEVAALLESSAIYCGIPPE